MHTMGRKRKKKSEPDSLKSAIGRAMSAFDSPEIAEKRAREEEEQREIKRDMDASHLNRELRRRGVPKKHARLISEGKVELQWEAMEAVSDTSNTLLVLSGNTGCGKTLAACTRIRDRVTGHLIRASELIEVQPDKYWSDRERMNIWRKCGVLVIDDLGTEHRDEKMLCRLDELIDLRVSSGLHTFITTNLTADEFQARYEGRIWSRLFEFGDYIELDDVDHRMEETEE